MHLHKSTYNRRTFFALFIDKIENASTFPINPTIMLFSFMSQHRHG
ncbi:hypothetical protein HPTD01_3667 [Halomonas sp. TD01]|nr:hypothetical protein HPTD01_3667 [Halomonas sp. TD01]